MSAVSTSVSGAAKCPEKHRICISLSEAALSEIGCFKSRPFIQKSLLIPLPISDKVSPPDRSNSAYFFTNIVKHPMILLYISAGFSQYGYVTEIFSALKHFVYIS